MTRFFLREGFAIITAGSAIEVIILVRQWRPAAITLDALLGDSSGWHMPARLKSDPELSHTPVAMASIVDDKNRGFALGTMEYLIKPVNPEGECRFSRKERA